MINKKYSALVIILAILIVIVLIIRQNNRVGDETKIGSILPLSGDLGSIGQEVNRGALIAVDVLKDEGIYINYIPEDDAFNPQKSVSAAQKLISVDKVRAVFVMAGEEAKPIVGLFDKAKLPLLISWDSNNDLKNSSPYLFSIGFSNEVTGETLATFMKEKLHLSNVAVISQIDEVGDIMTASFVKKFRELGGLISSQDRIPVTTNNFRSYIIKIKSEKADGVATFFLPPAHSLFAIQKKQLSLDIPVGGPDIIDEDIEQGGSAINGTYMTYTWTGDTDELAKRYEEKFATQPMNQLFTAFGFDSVYLLGKAEEISVKTGKSLADALRETKTNRTTSPIDMKGTNYSERTEKVFRIENGKRVLVE